MNPRGAEFRPVLSLTEAGAAMATRPATNPEKGQAAMDFVQGRQVPGPPPSNWAGLGGAIIGRIEEKLDE
ncbi:hypothetical protein [Paucidesulfovibrio longus]|uniref:hypothetical protein n=1 Tax=Paucidesulfovibrio longus TaxID=889 RepID=UPI00041D08DF|nr:hypothetical protein [Paucidesulfovibrio longus]